MAFQVTITDAGRQEIINAQNDGTAPVLIANVGLGTGAYSPDPAQTALQAQTKLLSTVAGEVVDADTIHVSVVDGSGDAYDVSEFGLFTDSGTLFAVYSEASGAFISKASESALLLAIDIKLATIDSANLTFGSTDFANPPASETIQGVVELADTDEAKTGLDPERAMTPARTREAMAVFGLGDVAPGVGDVNAVERTGFYTTTSSDTNAPFVGVLQHIEKEGDDAAVQILTSHEHRMQAQRARDNGAWQPWRSLAVEEVAPILPEVEMGDNKLSVFNSGLDVTVASGQSWIWRGARRFSTDDFTAAERTFTLSSNRDYHIRWHAPGTGQATPFASYPNGRFVLDDVTSEDILAPSRDTTYDDMLVASVDTPGGSPNLWAKINAARIRDTIAIVDTASPSGENLASISGTIETDYAVAPFLTWSLEFGGDPNSGDFDTSVNLNNVSRARFDYSVIRDMATSMTLNVYAEIG